MNREHPFEVVRNLKKKYKPEIVCRLFILILFLLLCFGVMGASFFIEIETAKITREKIEVFGLMLVRNNLYSQLAMNIMKPYFVAKNCW